MTQTRNLDSSTQPDEKRDTRPLQSAVVRFAGDSGDGIQLVGGLFTSTSGILGNDLATFPDYPAEIRAPAGTLPGVSSFQVAIASTDITTPGDQPDVLVAMNPAALMANLEDLPRGGTLLVNTDAFEDRGLQKAGYRANPLEDGSLAAYRVIPVALTTRTREALEPLALSSREKDRCKNFYALGIICWLYQRPLVHTIRWLEKKFARKALALEANVRALKAGWNYCDTVELFPAQYRIGKAPLSPGLYRNLNGNQALALGLVTAAGVAEIPLWLGSYPITPASEILHELSRYKSYGVLTFQAEDEIAAMGSTIGASYAGALAVTTTSGPGLALKGEAIGLAVNAELPVVVVNVQRGGPSTGLPTKTEQADLLQAMFGRNGECPVPILAAATPGDCFWTALEAARIALKHMVPVILLSDGSLANGSEPWRVPDVKGLEIYHPRYWTDPETFQPYRRDPETLARPWAVPGTPGLQHRIGGLEKEDGSGNVSYDPDNHEKMVHLRQEKVERIARDIPALEVSGDPEGEILVVGWGSTYGPITAAVQRAREGGLSVSHLHLRYLNPFPTDLGSILTRFRRVLIPEMNLGQLALLLRARYLVDAISFSKVQGQPFRVSEITERIQQLAREGK